MLHLTMLHLAGAIITFLLFTVLSVYSGKNIQNVETFNRGNNSAGMWLVAGGITGTLIGGSSTIGTAQSSFNFGLSSLWFVIGAALGALVLGLVLSRPMRESGCTTIQEIIRKEYGETAGIVTSLLNSVGIILNMVSQMLAATALLTSVFGLPARLSVAISGLAMIFYVVFGGIASVNLLGLIKLGLTYLSVVVMGWIALQVSGGWAPIYHALPAQPYFNLLSHGVVVDVGSAISVMLGVVISQSYIQIVLSGKSHAAARRGCFLSAALIPPIGLLCALVGQFMKIHHATIDSAQAIPQFVLQYVPPILSGVILAVLLLISVGSASGMALSFGTIITHDVFSRVYKKQVDNKKLLLISRLVIVLSLAFAAIFVINNFNSAILSWGFLALGSRAVVLLLPTLAAIYCHGKIDGRFATLSSIAGLLLLIVSSLSHWPLDAVFPGLAAALLLMFLGWLVRKKAAAFFP